MSLFYLKQSIDCYFEYNTSVLGVQTIDPKDVKKYGMVVGIHIEDRIYKVKYLVEKRLIEELASTVAILVIYIITQSIFEIYKIYI